MSPHLTAFAETVVRLGAGEPFFTLSEGLIKVRAIEAALSIGWTVQEGAPAPGAAFSIRRNGDETTVAMSPRLLTVADGSADMYVVDPFPMMLEIKARPDIGSKAQAQFDQMMADVERVAVDPRMALLFAFDPLAYESFAPSRPTTKGRSSRHKPWFNARFPLYREILNAGRVTRYVDFREEELELLFLPLPNPLGEERVLLLGSRRDSHFDLIG